MTADHVQPGATVAALDRLQEVTEAAGHTLAPRLTVHPRFAVDPERWLDARLHFSMRDRSDTDGYARDDAGSVWPERTMERAKVDDGAEFELTGTISTQWYVGAGGDPEELIPGEPVATGGPVAEVLDGVRDGQDVGFDEILTLFRARGREVAAVAQVADELRREAVGDIVTWVANRETSTLPTSAPSSVGSVGSRRGRCRSTCAAPRTS